MLDRLLMVVGGSTAFSPPSPASFALTSAPNGGNNPWTIAGALHHSGTTFFGWVDRSGNIECAEYSGGVVSGPYTIHAAFNNDAHDSPAFVRRASDGKWIVVYSRHNSTPINLRVSTNADDFSSWGAATNLDSQLGGARYTHYQIFERSGTLWMVYRDEPSAGTDSRWCISSCASATPTSGWAAQFVPFRLPSTRSYVVTHYDAVLDRLNFIATNAASTGYTKLGHFYRDMAAGTYHKSDGSGITMPINNFADITEIYSGGGDVFVSNLTADASGHPVVVGREGLDYTYMRYDGSSWLANTITPSGTGYQYGGASAIFQPWGHAVDDGDPNIVWLLKDDGDAQPQLWKYVTPNGGASFTATQITNNLSGEQTQVICVRNPSSDLRAFWQSGPWTYWDNGGWNQGLTGVGG